MQFKHPEILFALFLLVIPIIVHLFQLRRFEKVPFTNVDFLKQLEIQTRKSSKLKKFLVLITRLLALTGLIFAFAQPYFSALKKDEIQDTYVYLDNSYSMQAKGAKGELLKRASQDIIENFSNNKNLHFITNDKFLKNISPKDLKQTLLDLDYSTAKQDLNTTLLKIKSNFKKNKNTLNDILLISDFQYDTILKLDSINSYNIVQLQPIKTDNISIDSVYISNENNENLTLKVVVNKHNSTIKNCILSLYNESILLGKSTIDFLNKNTETVIFSVKNTHEFNGRLVIDDANLAFDNELYFTINKNDKINVLAIGDTTDYLSKIYTNNEFNYKSTKLNQLDYSSISKQHLIILNEIENIPNALSNNLIEYIKANGNLVIIPNKNSNLASYKSLLNKLSAGTLIDKVENELSVTAINFSHPVLTNVFEKQVDNFQYPTVKSYYNFALKNNSAILEFENEVPFISQSKVQSGTIYFLSAAIDKNNSNFKNSPLIVPIFYNFGKLSYQHSQLNYTIGARNNVEVKVNLNKDAILQIERDDTHFIPLQQIGNTSVKITLDNLPEKSGIYQLKNKDKTIKNLAFNYNRNESSLNYSDMAPFSKNKSNVHYFESVNNALTSINKEFQTSNLWHLFLLGAMLFLLIEVGLLKFLKP